MIKIDRAFVQRLDDDGGLTILNAVVAMAHGLKLDLVAEGIKQPSQARQLKVLGCGYGQGYLYGSPMPADDVEKLLPAWRARSYSAEG